MRQRYNKIIANEEYKHWREGCRWPMSTGNLQWFPLPSYRFKEPHLVGQLNFELFKVGGEEKCYSKCIWWCHHMTLVLAHVIKQLIIYKSILAFELCDLLTLCCFSNFSIYILKFLYFQLEMHSLQWKKILRGKGATKLKQMKILIWPGVKESSERGRRGRASVTGNNIDDQCNRETFNDLPYEIIDMRSLI